MSQVRKQSIISTVVVYGGLLIGFINTYLFTRQGSFFTPVEYGLTVLFISVGNIMAAVASMGMISVVYKFYPYYDDNLPKKKNDLLTWTLLISLIGFLFVILAGYVFKDMVVRKFGGNSPLFLPYYMWIFPFGFSILLFNILEVFGWQIRESVFTNFLKEVMFKLITLLLIFLVSYNFIGDFDGFIKLYSFSYGVLAVLLLVFLIRKRAFDITFTISRVTKRFYKKMVSMATLTYLGSVVFMISNFIDTIIIASLLGMAEVGIYFLGASVAGIVQAPKRGAIAASTPVLAKAWKDKDIAKIQMIYQRSGINLLIASLGIFLLLWLNFEDIVITFKLKPEYLNSVWIFFFLGLARVIDLGSGVNSQIIVTSTFWRFEFFSGVILLTLTLPLQYFLIKKFGIIGAGYANFISMTIYNAIRMVFLKRKFNIHPFTNKTVYAVILAFVCYGICYYLFQNFHGFLGIVLKGSVFTALYGGAIIYFNLSPDVKPVFETIKKRIGLGKK